MVFFRSPRRLVVALVILVSMIGCGGPPSPESQAKEIYEKARELEEKGVFPDAYLEYDRLADFSTTKTYKKAEAELAEKLLTPGYAAASWTVKRMFELKNDLLDQHRETHPEGDKTLILSLKDAWGSPLRLVYETDKKFTFVIISLGQDKLLQTEDDLHLYQHKVIGARKYDADSEDNGDDPAGKVLPEKEAQPSVPIGNISRQRLEANIIGGSRGEKAEPSQSTTQPQAKESKQLLDLPLKATIDQRNKPKTVKDTQPDPKTREGKGGEAVISLKELLDTK